MYTSKTAFGVVLPLTLGFSLLTMAFSQQPAQQRGTPTTQIQSRKSASLGCYPTRSGGRGGNCREEGDGCLVMFPWDKTSPMRKAGAKAAFVSEGNAEVREGQQSTLYYEFKSALPREVKGLPLDNDLTLDKAVAESLGFRSIVILKGKYPIDYSRGKFGGVAFNVRVAK